MHVHELLKFEAKLSLQTEMHFLMKQTRDKKNGM